MFHHNCSLNAVIIVIIVAVKFFNEVTNPIF